MPHKLKIGIFTDTFTPEINGVVSVLRMMTRELGRDGHEVHIFCPSYPGGNGAHRRVYHFPSVKLIFYEGMRVAFPYKRNSLRLISGLDIIHSHDPGPVGLLAWWASDRYKIPHIHTYHSYYMDYRRYLPRPIRPTSGMVRSLSRLLCNRCNAVIAPSGQMKQELEGYGITRPIYALPYGVDEDEFNHRVQWNIREELGLPDEELLLYAGRLGAEKNLDFLLRSFRRLLEIRPRSRLLIAGDGPYRECLERQAGDLEIAPYVFFTGFLQRPKLIDLYKQTMFVFPSKTDTQGLVLMEAMMAGAAAVAVGIMGPKDIIRSGETGILVNEDEYEFSQACNRLLENSAERQKIGTAAREWARSQSSRVSTKKLLDIYSGCFHGRFRNS